MGLDKMHNWITTGERALPLFLSPFAKSAPRGGNDDDEDDDDDSDDDEDDEDEDDLADKTDEELRAELKATRASLAKANSQSGKRRKALRERERELEEARKPKPKSSKKKADDDDDDDGPDLDSIRHEAKTEGEKAGLARAKRAEAKTALMSAGVNPARVARAVGLLDLDDLDLDDDGLDGVEDAIESLRTEWPELFAKKRQKRTSVSGDNDRNGDEPARKRSAKTPSELQAALVTGGR